MRNFSGTLLLVFAAITLSMTVESSAQQSAEAEILNRYIGSWRTEVFLKPSQWFPEGKRWVETNDIRWMLDGHLQQMVTSRDGKETDLRIQRYNPKTKRYETWIIHSSGDASYWVGSWNAQSETMNWKYVDFGNGVTGRMSDGSGKDGKGVTSILMEDVHGNVLLDGKIENTPMKDPTE
jgi:hypothetical protein